jgi:hypothetical protein
MKLTRRDALLMASYAVSRPAAAGTELAIANSLGIRVSPHGDRGVPALDVSLPDGTIAAVIEMPEHAWRKKSKTGEPDWFYRMYTNDARVQGRAEWFREDNALAYRMSLPSGVTLRARAALDADGVTIEYEIANPDSEAFAETEAPTCIKLYHPFTDVFLERTWVHHPDGLALMAWETPERMSKNAEEWLPCRYIVRCSPEAPAPAKRVERQPDGVTRYSKLRAADTAFLATESSPPGWVAATHSLTSPDVWTNPARTCHHADSGAPLPARGIAKLTLKLYVMRGNAQVAWSRVAARARDGQL